MASVCPSIDTHNLPLLGQDSSKASTSTSTLAPSDTTPPSSPTATLLTGHDGNLHKASSTVPAHSSLPSPLSPPSSVSPSSLGSLSMATPTHHRSLSSSSFSSSSSSSNPTLPTDTTLSTDPTPTSIPQASPEPSSTTSQQVTATLDTSTTTSTSTSRPPSTTTDTATEAPNFMASPSLLPPLHPSASSSTLTTDLSHPHLSRAGHAAASALPLIQTSPEQWLQHAAQQRRHMSSGSFSSVASTTSLSFAPTQSPGGLASITASPTKLVFSESERLSSSEEDNSKHNRTTSNSTNMTNATATMDSDDSEPEFDMNVRPSVLRASLLARAKRSSSGSNKKRSESMPFDHGSARLSMQSNMSSFSARRQ
ncbi:hypothetical protein BGZ94_004688, partial [Podila epigama]